MSDPEDPKAPSPVEGSDKKSSLPENWVNYITPFAKAIGLTVEEVTTALKELVGDPDDDAIALLKDEKSTPLGDFTVFGPKVPTARLRKAVAKLREVSAVPAAVQAPVNSVTTFDVLPQVPSDSSWLEALRAGGVLKVNKEVLIGVVSAALANKVGLYDLPEKIIKAMEAQADALEGPVPPEYYEVRNSLTRRNYADVFAAIPGGVAQYATAARKNRLLREIDTQLWSPLTSFQMQLKQWLESWQSGMANPAMMMGALAALAGGGGMVPPGMMQPPPTDSLRASAESVITSINRIFSGTGPVVASALAYDAQQIRKVLEDSALPAHVGAANRELMLRQFGVAVTSDYPRLERNLKQYMLGVLELPNVTAGNTELTYMTALYQLGAQIPWDKLTGGLGRVGTFGETGSESEEDTGGLKKEPCGRGKRY